MHLVLKHPTDEACEALHTLLAETFYYSDADEEENVCYTVSDSLEDTLTSWIAQAKAQGIVEDAEILDW